MRVVQDPVCVVQWGRESGAVATVRGEREKKESVKSHFRRTNLPLLTGRENFNFNPKNLLLLKRVLMLEI